MDERARDAFARPSAPDVMRDDRAVFCDLLTSIEVRDIAVCAGDLRRPRGSGEMLGVARRASGAMPAPLPRYLGELTARPWRQAAYVGRLQG